MNRVQLKIFAVLMMLLDHIAIFFINPENYLYSIFRCFGRITAPLMIYLLVEGFIYTSSHLKYGLRLFLIGIASQIPYALCFHNYHLNFLLELFLIFSILVFLQKKKYLLILILLPLSVLFDWGIVAPIIAITFYCLKSQLKFQLAAYTLISLIWSSYQIFFLNSELSVLWWFGMFLVLPLLVIYNHKQGVKNFFTKWFFYIFYPLHLLCIWIFIR